MPTIEPAPEPYHVLAQTFSRGQASTVPVSVSPQALDLETPPEVGLRRYEQLANATRTYIFSVLLKDGVPACTIHYPGVFQVTGYTAAEYAGQPVLWFNMIHPDDRGVVLRQIEQLSRGETPLSIKHRITHKNGTCRWLRNTSVPVRNALGTLIAYDGMVLDISESEFTEEAQERQITELKSALAMVKTLQSLLPICCSCKQIRDDDGYWQQIEGYIEGHYPSIGFTHGLCPECARTLYPAFYEEPVGRG